MKPEAKYIKALKELTSSVIGFESQLGILMRQPSTPKRGEQIAKLMNKLTIENQSALHFTLGYSFKKINNMYRQA